MLEEFERLLDDRQRAVFCRLDSPGAIQAFLHQLPYSTEPANRSPLSVLRDGVANCFDGALLAAAALRRLGHPPLIVDLLAAPGADDDHALAVFRRDGHWGAIAKSNMTGLRFREPVYRSLRELVMSYFEDYFSVVGEKTLRSYRRPLDLARLDGTGWMWSEAGVYAVIDRLERLRPIQLLTDSMAAGLSPVEGLAFQAGMLGADEAGLFKPKK
jgi:hypothetical protein